MTAMQQGPPGPGPAADAERAAALLRHAQRVAEELQARAEEEARQHTDEARSRREEAEQLHADALRAQDVAQRVLEDSSADARQIIADAGDQARLLMEAAQTHR